MLLSCTIAVLWLLGLCSAVHNSEKAALSIAELTALIGELEAEMALREATLIPANIPARLIGAPSTFRTNVGPRSTISEILSGDVACDLMLWKLGTCDMDSGHEGPADCIRRIGAKRLARVVPERCRVSPFFEAMLAEEESSSSGGGAEDDESWHSLNRTPQYRQQVTSRMRRRAYVPPEDRPPHSYHTGPRICNATNSPAPGCKMHPIGFHIPKNQIADKVEERKIFDFLPFIPRKFPISASSPSYTLGVHDEFLSNILHRTSYFAFTHRRGGWDCLRHLEILSSGCVPFFPDLAACGKFCMPQMPKDLLTQVPTLPGVAHIGHLPSRTTEAFETDYVALEETQRIGNNEPIKRMNFKTQGTVDWTSFDDQRYAALARQLLNFTQTYLSTQSLASYILSVLEYPEPKRVLFLSGPIYRYLIQSVVHGFYDLGIHYTVYPMDAATEQIEERWDEATQRSIPLTEEELEAQRHEFRLWQGLLYGYGMRTRMTELPPPDPVLQERIESGYYDLVIYPWVVHRHNGADPEFTSDKPFWKSVSSTLPPSRIVFIDTTDDVFPDPDEVLYEMCGKGVIFRRSLHDVAC